MLKQSASADRQITTPNLNPPRTQTSRVRKRFPKRFQVKTQHSRLAFQAANMTYLASQRDLLFDLNPFDTEYVSAEQSQRNEPIHHHRTQPTSEAPILIAYSEHGGNSNNFIKLAEDKLNQIINPKSRIYSGKIRRTYRERPKTDQQVMSEDYISEIKSAKKYQRLLRAKIQHKFCQLYPEKTASQTQFQFLTDLPLHQNKSKVERVYKEIEFKDVKLKKNNIEFCNTTFYSKSRKRLMGEAGMRSKEYNARRRLFQRKSISFFDYLRAQKSKKKELVAAAHIQRDASGLLKAKNRILKQSRPGSQQLQTLKRCLDQIIVGQVR